MTQSLTDYLNGYTSPQYGNNQPGYSSSFVSNNQPDLQYSPDYAYGLQQQKYYNQSQQKVPYVNGYYNQSQQQQQQQQQPISYIDQQQQQPISYIDQQQQQQQQQNFPPVPQSQQQYQDLGSMLPSSNPTTSPQNHISPLNQVIPQGYNQHPLVTSFIQAALKAAPILMQYGTKGALPALMGATNTGLNAYGQTALNNRNLTNFNNQMNSFRQGISPQTPGYDQIMSQVNQIQTPAQFQNWKDNINPAIQNANSNANYNVMQNTGIGGNVGSVSDPAGQNTNYENTYKATSEANPQNVTNARNQSQGGTKYPLQPANVHPILPTNVQQPQPSNQQTQQPQQGNQQPQQPQQGNVVWSNSKTPQIDNWINQYSKQYHVDPNLIRGIIQQESGFNPNAQSHAGAQGLMQLMPGTAKDAGVINSFDPQQNIAGGVKHFAGLMAKYHNNIDLALAAHNAGGGAVDAAGGIPNITETQNFVKNVKAIAARNQGNSTLPKIALNPSNGQNQSLPTVQMPTLQPKTQLNMMQKSQLLNQYQQSQQDIADVGGYQSVIDQIRNNPNDSTTPGLSQLLNRHMQILKQASDAGLVPANGQSMQQPIGNIQQPIGYNNTQQQQPMGNNNTQQQQPIGYNNTQQQQPMGNNNTQQQQPKPMTLAQRYQQAADNRAQIIANKEGFEQNPLYNATANAAYNKSQSGINEEAYTLGKDLATINNDQATQYKSYADANNTTEQTPSNIQKNLGQTWPNNPNNPMNQSKMNFQNAQIASMTAKTEADTAKANAGKPLIPSISRVLTEKATALQAFKDYKDYIVNSKAYADNKWQLLGAGLNSINPLDPDVQDAAYTNKLISGTIGKAHLNRITQTEWEAFQDLARPGALKSTVLAKIDHLIKTQENDLNKTASGYQKAGWNTSQYITQPSFQQQQNNNQAQSNNQAIIQNLTNHGYNQQQITAYLKRKGL